MSQLVTTERASHWYKLNGQGWEACYEVPKADGSGMRNATLADARKLGLVPSVTKILGVLHKPQLEAWKIEQGILAALTLPRLEGETDDAFARRVVEDAEAQSAKAREFGSKIHDACEQYALYRRYPADPEFKEFMLGYANWDLANVKEVYAVEKIVGNVALGYAGKLDLHVRLVDGRNAIIDIKTQGVKKDAKGKRRSAVYNDWGRQLAAYQHCGIMPASADDVLLNLVIDSNEPGPVHVHQWTPEETLTLWEGFQLCHRLWCLESDWKYNGV